jgi:hypothetical protein
MKLRTGIKAELLRPDDLLHLRVDGVNLRISQDESKGPLLVVDEADRPAFLCFTFAPQAIAESAFFEAALVHGTTTPITPENSPRRQDPDEKNTTHDPLPLRAFSARRRS